MKRKARVHRKGKMEQRKSAGKTFPKIILMKTRYLLAEAKTKICENLRKRSARICGKNILAEELSCRFTQMKSPQITANENL